MSMDDLIKGLWGRFETTKDEDEQVHILDLIKYAEMRRHSLMIKAGMLDV